MSHVTVLGCTLYVGPGPEMMSPDTGARLLSMRMEQEGDGRYHDVVLSTQDRRWLARELLLGLKPQWYLARCDACEMILPFDTEQGRDGWAATHSKIEPMPFNLHPHHIDIYEEDQT